MLLSMVKVNGRLKVTIKIVSSSDGTSINLQIEEISQDDVL